VSARQIALVAGLALASAIGGFFLYKGTLISEPVSDVAQMAPPFVLPDIEGNPRESSEWDGQIRLVNFWATWCPPCRREIPLLIELQKEYDGRIQILGIAIDELPEVQAYAASTDFNYPVLTGQQNAIELGNTFLNDFIGLPFTAFVDESGHIVRVHVGELHREQADAFLAEIL